MDPISNFINTLKVASRQGAESFSFPASRMIASIGEALVKAKYLASVSKKGKKGQLLEIILATGEGAPKVTEAKRISKLSKRMYRGAKELHSVRNGSGIAVISTPRGVLSDRDARAAKVGGEVLFEMW